MSRIVVSSKEELKKAKKQGYDYIIVEGELAKQIKKAQSITKLGAIELGILVSAIAAVPLTGGLSVAAAIPIATLTGLEVATIIAVSSIGVGLIIALFKGYNVEYSKDADGNMKAKFEKK